ERQRVGGTDESERGYGTKQRWQREAQPSVLRADAVAPRTEERLRQRRRGEQCERGEPETSRHKGRWQVRRDQCGEKHEVRTVVDRAEPDPQRARADEDPP